MEVISERPIFINIENEGLDEDIFTVDGTGLSLIRTVKKMTMGISKREVEREVFEVHAEVVKPGVSVYEPEFCDVVELHTDILRLDKACVLLVQELIGHIVQDKLYGLGDPFVF
jgi:hypothetical protein